MTIRSTVLKTLVALSLILSPALTHSAFAGGKGDSSNDGRDSGGGHGNNPPDCGDGPCERTSNDKLDSVGSMISVEYSDEKIDTTDSK